MRNLTSILLIVGILLVVNFLADRFFLRMDLTADKQYTLSKATLDILDNLKDKGEPVTVTAYFSDNLPPEIAKSKRDFRDLLTEYANRSGGFVNFEFVAPTSDEEKQKAAQNGIQPVMLNVREKDQMKAQQAFMGASIKFNNQQEVIPVIQPGMAVEYALSTSIKKMSVVEKPVLGLVQGHGEPPLNQLSQAYEQLSILYNVQEISLDSGGIDQRIKSIAIIAPADSFPPQHFAILDSYLSNGGNIFVAINAVQGDLQNAQGSATQTGLENWLKDKGVEVEPSFLIDASCGSVTIQQQQGFFTMQTPVQFPFLPLISQFTNHPIGKGIEQVILPFASPIRFLGKQGLTFSPIALSSAQSGIVQTPTTFDIVNRQWTSADFPLKNLVAAGVLEGQIVGSGNAKMVVVGDGDFCVTGQRGQSADNINLMVNSLDWLSDDTGLIDLRTKGATSRPIEQMDDATRAWWKYFAFLFPLGLVVLYGIYRFQKQRNIRMRRMQESYL